MSALQQLIANSAAESQGSQSEAGNKFEKRFNELTRRRENALKDTKGTARWWLWLIPVLVCDPDTKEATRVELQCALCSLKLSASNESRIAGSHLKTAGCKVVQSDPEVAAKVAAAFLKPAAAAEDASADKENETDSQLLQQLASKKRKTSDQPSIVESFVSEAKQKQLTEKFYDFFLENSDCVAVQLSFVTKTRSLLMRRKWSCCATVLMRTTLVLHWWTQCWC